MFDDASFYRIAAEGPSYNVKVIDLFQDNFSGDGTITGTVGPTWPTTFCLVTTRTSFRVTPS
jgi:hypothetical protein